MNRHFVISVIFVTLICSLAISGNTYSKITIGFKSPAAKDAAAQFESSIIAYIDRLKELQAENTELQKEKGEQKYLDEFLRLGSEIKTVTKLHNDWKKITRSRDQSGADESADTPLKKSASDHKNKIFADAAAERASLDAEYLSSIPEEKRLKLIKAQFSAWDGSHKLLVKTVKQSMNDPDSFEHVETRYADKKSYIIIAMQFRGKNAFGAKVLNSIAAKVNIDGSDFMIIKE